MMTEVDAFAFIRWRINMLYRKDIEDSLQKWYRAWSNHDFKEVMELFHDEIFFENWTGGKAIGKEALMKAWSEWFAKKDFQFTEEETFIDEAQQKALYRWQLDWPSFEPGYEGKREIRRGVDVIHFKEGKIIRKLTYSKTTILIDGKKIRLSAEASRG
jgi:ketosteroid isomerase-like protein